MSKIKIEIELDIDFQKFFDNIPAGLYKEKDTVDKEYELEAIYDVFRKCYTNALINKADWIAHKDYKYAEHHILIEEEISKQISKNFKIISHDK